MLKAWTVRGGQEAFDVPLSSGEVLVTEIIHPDWVCRFIVAP